MGVAKSLHIFKVCFFFSLMLSPFLCIFFFTDSPTELCGGKGMAVWAEKFKNTQENRISTQKTTIMREKKTTVIIKVHPWMCTYPLSLPFPPHVDPLRRVNKSNPKGSQRTSATWSTLLLKGPHWGTVQKSSGSTFMEKKEREEKKNTKTVIIHR